MVRLFMDFDSTITEDSTLMQIYMRMPKEILEKAVNISNDYYRYEEPLTQRCYKNLNKLVNETNNLNKFITLSTLEIFRYSKEIEDIELKGMYNIEQLIKFLDVKKLAMAALQIKTRRGYEKFVGKFNEEDRYIISFNWSDFLVKLVCMNITNKNIFSNIIRIQSGKCIGFNRRRILLTPEHKFNYFNKLKDIKNVFCGDSLPDLLLCLYSDVAFAFPSHDKEFPSICKKLNEKFSKEIYIVNNFNEASTILNKIKLS